MRTLKDWIRTASEWEYDIDQDGRWVTVSDKIAEELIATLKLLGCESDPEENNPAFNGYPDVHIPQLRSNPDHVAISRDPVVVNMSAVTIVEGDKSYGKSGDYWVDHNEGRKYTVQRDVLVKFLEFKIEGAI